VIQVLFISFIISWLVCCVLILFKHYHQHITSDHVDSGPQKIHHGATPRIGGLPIFIGLMAGMVVMALGSWKVNSWAFIVTLLPAWFAGMYEDLTKTCSPLNRLLAAFFGAIIGIWLLDARLVSLENPLVDHLLTSYFLVSAALTLIAVGGITHAINIIDGFNGLAGVIVVMILSALAYVCNEVGDTFLFAQCIGLIGATIGFLCWNYPKGAIFAGDGGAYLWGFVIAEISVLLLYRNPQVSSWFPVLLLIYPTWETIFSIYRRKIVRGRPAGLPDGIHLHSLIYKRLVRRMVGSKEAAHMMRRNSMTSPYLWTLASFSIVPAVFFWKDTGWLLLFIVAFIIVYGVLYTMIVRFKVKRWMIIGNRTFQTNIDG
jgi:UDP-N-acetylmuramyl pentapeptide phosphotransferase/UDP-N-acetylglucosamine-1-phosphate transferase